MTHSLSRWQVHCISAALFVATTLLLMATNSMGFTRDESFYFGYAESYQAWFEGVADADDVAERRTALGRERTVEVWQGNFEHPPLMKTVFGFAWRYLARKDRRVTRVTGSNSELTVHVGELGPADGFTVGDEVLVLAPLRSGMDASDSRRILASGVIKTRSGRRATVSLARADESIKELCQLRPGTRGEDIVLTGCQVREKRAFAWFSEVNAMRFVAALFSAAAVVLTFWFGLTLFGCWLTGLFGALAFLFVPRHFFQAHLVCFDMAIVTATLATLYAFWRSLDDRRWALVTGLCWGIALLIKHNALFLPVPLVLYWLWCGRHEFGLTRRRWRFRVQLPALPLALLVMPVIGLTMLFVFWPRLWYDPFRALVVYLDFHLAHVHYMQWYFGLPLQVPPFPVAFPFTLTLFTLPEVWVFLMGVGVYCLAPVRTWWNALRRVFRREAPSRRERAVVFALLNGLLPICLIALPSVPIFGGVKHWMTGMPFLMLLAGYGLAQALRTLVPIITKPWLRAVLIGLCVFGVFLGPVSASLRATPYGTGYYNALLAGGLQGAADKQMMRMYWGHSSRQALPWLNARLGSGARVYFQNTTHQAYEMYRREGLLRADIRYARTLAGADVALIEPQKAFGELDIEARETFAVSGPKHVVSYEGVPFLRVYVRPSTKLKDIGLPE